MVSMDLIERVLVAMVEKDRRELRRQREEIKKLKALFKQREEEFARQLAVERPDEAVMLKATT